MYLKKVDGPRAVTLPDGSVMSRADLPEPNTGRWVASRKAAVVRAVIAGLIKREDALDLYDISDEEYDLLKQAQTAVRNAIKVDEFSNTGWELKTP